MVEPIIYLTLIASHNDRCEHLWSRLLGNINLDHRIQQIICILWLQAIFSRTKEHIKCILWLQDIFRYMCILKYGDLWSQQTMAAIWLRIASMRPLKCCGLWPQRTPTVNSLYETSQMLWNSAIVNCGGFWPQK